MSDTNGTTADVIIIGAGIAGAAAASVLGRKGVRVILVDQRQTYPDCFKAEKIEPDQADLLRRLELFDVLAPHLTPIHRVECVRDGHTFGILNIEQYGMYYGPIARAIREAIPAAVEFRQARVVGVTNGPNLQRVTLDNRDVLTSRLVVFACGIMNACPPYLGVDREMIAKDFSMAFGFTIARRDGAPFPFDALTYDPSGVSTRVAFLTLFPIGDTMRANFFVYRANTDPWVRKFLSEPKVQLDGVLPKLASVIGDYVIVSKVESGRVDLYRLQGQRQPGLVFIADACQSVCPTTGTGLSKVLTDVEVLCRDCVPNWLSTPGMGADKIAEFYDHPQKQAVDSHSLESALNMQRRYTSDSIRWRMRAAYDQLAKSVYMKLTHQLRA